MTRASDFAYSRVAVRSFARRWRAVASALLLLLGAVAVLAGLDYHARRDALRQQADAAIVIGGEQITQTLDTYRRLAAQLADAPVDDAVEQARLRDLVNLAPRLASGIRGATVFDTTGTYDSSDLPDRSRAARAETASQLVGWLAARPLALIPARGNERLLTLAVPRHDADGHETGFAAIAFDATALDIAPPAGWPGRFELVALPEGKTADTPPAHAAERRETRIAGWPLVLRFASPTEPVIDAWRGTWERNLILVVVVAVLVAIGVRLGQRRRARLAALRRQRRQRETVALRRDLGELTAAARRADEANRTRSRFFAQVTHELRTPLNAVLGFSEAIRTELFGPVGNQRYVEYAGLINEAGEHLLSLIDDLLDMAKLEAGKMEIAPIRVSAAALARSVLDLFELAAQQRNISLTAIGIETCPDLHVDLRAAKQVLINLLSNALKYTGANGRIDVRFAGRPDGAVVITVSDTGAGMSDDDLRVALEPFGRGKGAGDEPGTGLGLPLARSLAALHGGDLTLSSISGQGTRATVVFPPDPAAATPPKPVPLRLVPAA